MREAARSNALRGTERGARGADFHLMRRLNRLSVLNWVRTRGPVARVAIARNTGLSRTTVGSIIDELLCEKLVREGEHLDAAPSGGRRATLVHFNGDAGRVLGVDLGRTHFIALATNLSADVIARASGPFQSELGPEVCLPRLVAELRAFAQSAGISWGHTLGVGMGIPGPVDAEHGMLVQPPGMPGWDGVKICSILQRELGVPIYLDNDANMGAVGESRFGAGRGVADMAYVKVATGIGCGLMIKGAIYRGSHGSAGELGHVTMDEEGVRCDCDNRGCLETIASGPAIVRDANARRAPGAQPRALTDIADVVRAALEGDTAARAAIQGAGNHIGVALAGLVNLMNPSLILVDGGVARAGELLLEPIRRVIVARSLKAGSATTRVLLGELGPNAIALGAVASVIDAVFSSASALAIPARERADAHVAHLARAT